VQLKQLLLPVLESCHGLSDHDVSPCQKGPISTESTPSGCESYCVTLLRWFCSWGGGVEVIDMLWWWHTEWLV